MRATLSANAATSRSQSKGGVMTTRRFLQERRQTEHGAFTRVIEALPRDRFDYRPHERSPSSAEIVWTLTLATKGCSDLVDHGEMDWVPSSPPSDVAELVSGFEQEYAALDERIARLDDKGWQRPVRFLANGQLGMEAPLGKLLWYLFFDAIHHRGQLSTYIRPMGGKVPSIYGPSGDDPGR